MNLQVMKLSEQATIPTKAHVTDSGFDLYASDDVYIVPGQTVVVPTDIAINLPEGFEAQVRPRSGVTSKTKLRVQLGTIDNAYTGPIGIIVDNISLEWAHAMLADGRKLYDSVQLINGEKERTINGHLLETYKIRKGDKIAQLVVQLVALPNLEVVDEITTKERGVNGFGSSGTR